VAAFLEKRLSFLEIAAIVSDTLDCYDPTAPQTLAEVLAVDAGARRIAAERIEDRSR
jgi:1-deoxy-D-xylulose-5-phosphate reductoisomerase